MLKKTFIITLLLIGVQLTHAQINPQWVRYPSISPDGNTIVFTYKGDLYKVATKGGQAVQLTFHEAHDFHPVWSPDGKNIAFASDRYGNFDVFTMDINGGNAKRLTFHSNDEIPFSFTPDGRQILFGGVRQDLVTHRQYPTASQPELYSVPANGGRVDQFLTVPAEEAMLSKNGKTLVYHDKKGGENEWRKHQQSTIARDIWTYDTDSGKHTKITSFYGENRQPVFTNSDQDIYYLSEEKGSFNVFKLALANPNAKTQITHLTNYPVRFLSASNDGLLAFSYGGEIYTVREGSEPQKINISLYTQNIKNKDGFTPISSGIGHFSVSSDGKEVAFVSRGEVFVNAVDGKFTKRITNTPETENFVDFAPDGKSIVYASERDGRWQIFQVNITRSDEPFFYASTLLEEKPLVSNDKDNYQPKFSPDGKKLAFIEDRRTLKVMDLETKNTVTLMTPEQMFHMRDGDQYFQWSPDSKWLLASWRQTMANGEVVLLDASGKQPMKNLTQSGYNDYNPKWVNGGKQIIWFSNRNGLQSHAFSGSSHGDVYTLFLTKEGWDKFNLSEDEFKLQKEIEKLNKAEKDKLKKDPKKDTKDSKKDTSKSKEIEAIKIDWHGLEDRKARLTIHSSSLSDAVLSKDAETLYYLALFEKNANLWSTNLRTRETKMEMPLDGRGGKLVWDKDENNLFLLSQGRLAKINISGKKRENIQISSGVEFDTEAERAQLFEHVWLRTQKMFYTPDMHGVDWNKAKTDYQKFVPHIGNEYEFAELLSEMIGELNVSHAGGRYSNNSPNGDATASLGIFMDYSHKGNGIKIAEILLDGPMDKSGMDVKVGTIITKIDGEIISSDKDIAQYLNRKAEKFTLLELQEPGKNTTRQLTVKPISLGQENQILYKRWVKANQEEVSKKSNGTLGYVHLTGMNDGQYRNAFELMKGKYADAKGVIVDTRFNGGGDLVADLDMFLSGSRILTYATADREVGYEPNFRWNKPTLAMFNEANYSDGHCFSCAYTEMNIGKTVGQAVPGTCSFAGWESLPNGVRWGAVPISVKNRKGEWLENNETQPTFSIKNDPQLISIGKDQQLEKAIEELLKDVK